MERLLTRRDFLIGALGAGAAVSAEMAIVRKPTIGELTPQVVARLRERSAKLASFVSETRAADINAQLPTSSIIESRNIAQSLAMLAFLDGGFEEADQVVNFIRSQGLYIKFEELVQQGAAGFTNHYIRPPRVGFDAGYAKRYLDAKNKTSDPNDFDIWVGDLIMLHELAHIVQWAKDPDHYEFNRKVSMAASIPSITAVTSAPITYDIYVHCIGSIMPKETEINRRTFLQKSSLFVGGLAAGLNAGTFVYNKLFDVHDLRLNERQADLQAKRLLANPNFGQLRGNLLLNPNS